MRYAGAAVDFIRTQGRSLTDSGGPLGACRIVTAEAVKTRRGAGLPPGKQEALVHAHWFDA